MNLRSLIGHGFSLLSRILSVPGHLHRSSLPSLRHRLPGCLPGFSRTSWGERTSSCSRLSTVGVSERIPRDFSLPLLRPFSESHHHPRVRNFDPSFLRILCHHPSLVEFPGVDHLVYLLSFDRECWTDLLWLWLGEHAP